MHIGDPPLMTICLNHCFEFMTALKSDLHLWFADRCGHVTVVSLGAWLSISTHLPFWPPCTTWPRWLLNSALVPHLCLQLIFVIFASLPSLPCLPRPTLAQSGRHSFSYNQALHCLSRPRPGQVGQTSPWRPWAATVPSPEQTQIM